MRAKFVNQECTIIYPQSFDLFLLHIHTNTRLHVNLFLRQAPFCNYMENDRQTDRLAPLCRLQHMIKDAIRSSYAMWHQYPMMLLVLGTKFTLHPMQKLKHHTNAPRPTRPTTYGTIGWLIFMTFWCTIPWLDSAAASKLTPKVAMSHDLPMQFVLEVLSDDAPLRSSHPSHLYCHLLVCQMYKV